MHGIPLRAFVRLTLCLVGLLTIQAARANPPPALPHVAQRIEARQALHIIAFGSSSTEGIGATTKDRSYPARLEAALMGALPKGMAVSVLNRGIGGEDVDDMMARLPAIIAERPDLVIWQTGSNDSLRSVRIEHFVTETHDGIARMQAAGIDVMLMEPQLSQRLAHTPDSDAFRDAVRNLGRAMSVPVVRRYDLMRDWMANGTLTYTQMMSNDGLHMTDGGYELLARSVARMILEGANATTAHVAVR